MGKLVVRHSNVLIFAREFFLVIRYFRLFKSNKIKYSRINCDLKKESSDDDLLKIIIHLFVATDSIVLYNIPFFFYRSSIGSKVGTDIVFVGYGIFTSFWGILSWQEHGSFCKKEKKTPSEWVEMTSEAGFLFSCNLHIRCSSEK